MQLFLACFHATAFGVQSLGLLSSVVSDQLHSVGFVCGFLLVARCGWKSCWWISLISKLLIGGSQLGHSPSFPPPPPSGRAWPWTWPWTRSSRAFPSSPIGSFPSSSGREHRATQFPHHHPHIFWLNKTFFIYNINFLLCIGTHRYRDDTSHYVISQRFFVLYISSLKCGGHIQG